MFPSFVVFCQFDPGVLLPLVSSIPPNAGALRHGARISDVWTISAGPPRASRIATLSAAPAVLPLKQCQQGILDGRPSRYSGPVQFVRSPSRIPRPSLFPQSINPHFVFCQEYTSKGSTENLLGSPPCGAPHPSPPPMSVAASALIPPPSC